MKFGCHSSRQDSKSYTGKALNQVLVQKRNAVDA